MKVMKMTFGVACLLCAVATPGYCEAILSFSGAVTGGTITVTGTSTTGTLTVFNDVPFAFLSITGAPDDNGSDISITDGELTYDTSTHDLTLQGEITSLGINSVQTLVSAMVPAADVTATTNYPTDTSVSVSFDDATSVTINSTLLTDMGFTGSTVDTVSNGAGATGSCTASCTGTYSAISEILGATVTASTPEPAPFALLGAGLLAIGFARRKRGSKSRASV